MKFLFLSLVFLTGFSLNGKMDFGPNLVREASMFVASGPFDNVNCDDYAFGALGGYELCHPGASQGELDAAYDHAYLGCMDGGGYDPDTVVIDVPSPSVGGSTRE